MSTAELTYTVAFGPITRVLPVRGVKPGVSVALFNPLGDWELTEAIGAELVKLVPAETEVLLHQVGVFRLCV